MMNNTKMNSDETTMAIAASVATRAHELISEGWVQDTLATDHMDGFCIHGAIYCALEEVFGTLAGKTHVDGMRMLEPGPAKNVEAVVTAFVVDEATEQFGYKPIHSTFDGAARFNDDKNRKLEDVLSVMGAAADRLWNVVTDESAKGWVPSKWQEEEKVEEIQQFLYIERD